ncbi:MAG: response regulator [Betaproteobacteria bacterium]|nr:response regulator [Betaproteobacteria bacterium]
MSENLLVVDDDEDIRELLRTYLGSVGYTVLEAADAKALRAVLTTHPIDLILLDQRLPDADGLVLAREIRADSDVGIIIITGFGQPVDRILGLELGADDYVAKPVDLRELLARIRSVLRRRSPRPTEPPGAIDFEGWSIDPSARRLTAPGGRVVELTSGEFDLLMIFARHPNRVLSRDEIMNALHHREAGPYDRAIDVQVGRLRRKIESDPTRPVLIKSVRGAGYLFAPKVTQQ